MCYEGLNNGKRNNWMTCIECDGRIHSPDCSAKITSKDCSPKRHEKMGLPIESAQIRDVEQSYKGHK